MISKLPFASRPHRLTLTSLVAVLVLSLGQFALGQTNTPAPLPKGVAANGSPMLGGNVPAGLIFDSSKELAPEGLKAPEVKTAGVGATNLGLKMHGHWVIDVKNPDGKLVEHRDFENSLSASAQGILVGMLMGQFVPGNYMIAMGAQTGNAPCVAVFQFCGIAQGLTTSPATNYCTAYYCSYNLTVNPNFGTSFSGPYSIVMAGSITANQTGTIGTVYTIYSACSTVPVGTNPTTPVNVSPSTCVNTTTNVWVGPLSAAAITPVPVNVGQIIQVSVTITFS